MLSCGELCSILKKSWIAFFTPSYTGGCFYHVRPTSFLERQVYAVARDDQGSQVSIASGWKILEHLSKMETITSSRIWKDRRKRGNECSRGSGYVGRWGDGTWNKVFFVQASEP